MNTNQNEKKPAAGRSGIVAVVGRANTGKSTLVNCILEEKISIVSPVAQTTRNVIRGVLTEPRGQMVFLDTPGIHKAESELGKIMNRSARASTGGTDVILMVFDASRPPRDEDEGWMRRAIFETVPVVAVLNKTDEPEDCSGRYLDRWHELEKEKNVQKDIPWLRTSALQNSGVRELVDFLFDRLPEGPHLFPDDVLTDFPRKLAIADIIREKLFHRLREELPHSVAVTVDTFDEAADGNWDIKCTIYVNRHSQKAIVIGEKGRLLRSVRLSSQKEIKAIYDHPVNLTLWVKVEPNWAKNFWLLKKLGYQ
ncbi:MAG: GTPase Era [Kiritimatiellia bacterium]